MIHKRLTTLFKYVSSTGDRHFHFQGTVPTLDGRDQIKPRKVTRESCHSKQDSRWVLPECGSAVPATATGSVPPCVEIIVVANWIAVYHGIACVTSRSTCVSSVTQGHRGEWLSLLSHFSACFKTLGTKPSCFVCSADKDTKLYIYIYEVQFFRRRMCAVCITIRKIITDKSCQLSDLKVTRLMC